MNNKWLFPDGWDSGVLAKAEGTGRWYFPGSTLAQMDRRLWEPALKFPTCPADWALAFPCYLPSMMSPAVISHYWLTGGGWLANNKYQQKHLTLLTGELWGPAFAGRQGERWILLTACQQQPWLNCNWKPGSGWADGFELLGTTRCLLHIATYYYFFFF